MFACTRERFLEELLFPKQNQKQTELFLSARGYFRIQPSQHKLFMSMLCPIPHTVLLILSLSRAQPSTGLISNNYLIATPSISQQLQGCPVVMHGENTEQMSLFW